MDLMTVLGLVIGLGAVYIVMYCGKIVHLLFNPMAALLVFGGTFGATLITYQFRVLKAAPLVIFRVLFPPKSLQPEVVINKIVELAESAKRSGKSALQSEVETSKDKFLKDGIQMLLDGLDPTIIRENLEKTIIFTRRRHQQVSAVFRTMGTYAPIFGLLGTLIGVVQVLQNISDPASMGASMAIAVTTTFYGIFGTNFVFLPITGKLESQSNEEMINCEVVIEGILAIEKGDIPIIVKRKLESFLAYQARSK